ncbi:M13 family metallopeptidase [Edaphobacter aggregans]|uniref:M13 family metallopeptidase n=1 Tax=Edaphobacter aggregans TaxID=570835 RepID=UPI00068993C5|nr:M13 family metallopeptidase [Edaphobacter aggregans]
MPFRKTLFTLFLTLPILFTHAEDTRTTPATHGIAVTSIDTSVRPGDDFYHYANGSWINRTQLPADRASLGAFNLLVDRSNKRVAAIIEQAAQSNAAPNTDARRIADLYRSYMNEQAIEDHGLTPIKPLLDEIAAVHTQKELAHALGLSLRADVDALNNTNFHTANIFGLWVAPGFNDPDHYAAYLLQGGIQLPNRDYYLTDSPHMKDIREKYQAHIAKIFELAGIPDGPDRAARVLALEHAIAENQLSLAESEDIHKANNVWTPADFSTKAPGLDWPEFFRAAGLDNQQSFIVWQPTAFTGESALVKSESIDAWKDLLAFHLLEAYGGTLPKSIADERFAFNGTVLQGVTQMRPRDIRGVTLVNGILGDAVGQIYAKQYFTPESKAQVEALVANLKAAFKTRLQTITWMAPSTKKEAITKLDALQVSVGYPEHWRSYASLVVKPDDLVGNVYRSDLFDYHYEVARIGTPTDRKEWTMEPQTVNAVNLPLHNALNFPAAILEPPFFDPKAPAAANYGAIGTVIGHEVSHTFDSEGAAFDDRGRVRNWWTPEDFAHFQKATDALAAQYDTYHPFPDVAVNGRQTLSENIADVAGVSAAFDAYHASLKGKPAPVVGNLSGDQQFFLAYAQNWGSKVRDNTLRQQVLTDPHAPGMYRAATVRNIEGWYTAFNIKPTDKLYLAPNDRVRIW